VVTVVVRKEEPYKKLGFCSLVVIAILVFANKIVRNVFPSHDTHFFTVQQWLQDVTHGSGGTKTNNIDKKKYIIIYIYN